ncbi:hypothetical protein UFOVP1071_160 [uncultured Caudovirales phage]|uniref:EF-hand domain-containing protein n=1 Tax=uncultured Caudovirales phage TaxID=2100421 RepID=A0A6J5QCS7_9CAUD|nr:hypothetical protein UFOVP1071_160 [uncultured Caudovirales phage]
MTDLNAIRDEIGDIGEQIVQEYFTSTRSVYKYDSDKDGHINENQMKYAVKTFRLNKKTEGFWLSDNYSQIMWKNIDEKPLLFFVRVPETINDPAELYLAIDHRNSFNMVKTNAGKPCRNYPLNSCLKLRNISGNTSKTLYELSLNLRKVD